MIEMARIRLHGFSDREINQARASMMSDVESAYIERDQDYSQVGSSHVMQAYHASFGALVSLGRQGQSFPWQLAGSIGTYSSLAKGQATLCITGVYACMRMCVHA